MFEAKAIMTSNVISVKPHTTIYEVMNILVSNHVSGLPVVDDNFNLIGVISEKDLLGLLIDSQISENDPVKNFMTKNVVSFKENDLAIDICEFLMKGAFRRVPITKDGKLVGIVSRRDIIKTILKVRGRMTS